ncbi:MAG: type I-E CRISPR-associated protein Cse1/CasA [Verrucomicrobiota bacterium]
MNFNLTSDPWIPVRWLDGRSTSVSLCELFADAAQISDLAVPPHERISILRLLVCITQAAHGAPETSDDWDGWDIGLESSVSAYLVKWKDHFHLMGEGTRFLQSPIKDDKDYPTAQIVFHFATGNTPTLLDHAGDDDRELTPAFIARALLVYQNHFVGGSLASKVKGNGPALKAVHSLLIGGNLQETIILNCIDQETLHPGILGQPVWEGGKSDYLARLAPGPCKLWLVKDGKRICIDQGTVYDEYETAAIRETSSTIIIGKRGGIETKVLLRASPGKGIWRDLHCITVIQKGELNAPLTFRSHIQAQDDGLVSFWSGELIKAKDAKILDAVESVFTVPFQLFTPAGQARYQAGVKFSEEMSNRIYGAVKTYFATLKQESGPTESAKRHFWNTLDQQSEILLTLLKGIGTADDPMGSSNFGEARDPWTTAVRAAANAAYEHTCPRGNPRQYEAYAAGLRVLHPLPKKSKTTPRKPVPASSDS